jgi:hypothetical protein
VGTSVCDEVGPRAALRLNRILSSPSLRRDGLHMIYGTLRVRHIGPMCPIWQRGIQPVSQEKSAPFTMAAHSFHSFPDNLLVRALTAQGGTKASTLPPSLAISFTILELK